MNKELNTIAAANEVNIHIGGIRHPENGNSIFEGMDINVRLTDKAYAEELAQQLNAAKFALPLIAEQVKAFTEKMIAREDELRKARREAQAAENAKILSDWEQRISEWEKASEEYEADKAKYEEELAAWKERQANKKKDDTSFDPQPTFYGQRPLRPSRPHLNICY